MRIEVAAGVRSAGGLPLRREPQSRGGHVVGKTETYEFAYGFPTNASHFKPTHNPWNSTTSAGVPAAAPVAPSPPAWRTPAWDRCTGGSIRWPAFCTGIVGLKGTYGRVSRRGVFPLSWTLDHTDRSRAR